MRNKRGRRCLNLSLFTPNYSPSFASRPYRAVRFTRSYLLRIYPCDGETRKGHCRATLLTIPVTMRGTQKRSEGGGGERNEEYARGRAGETFAVRLREQRRRIVRPRFLRYTWTAASDDTATRHREKGRKTRWRCVLSR